MKLRNKLADISLKRPLFSFSSFMLATAVGLVSSFTFSAVYDMARAALSNNPQTISGVWRGRWQDSPAVTIRLEQEGNALHGTAQFYRVVATADGPQTVGETVELPLLNPQLEGQRLSFEVRGTDEAHQATVAELEMWFDSDGEAELRRMGGQPEGAPEDKEPSIKMKRERSF